MSRLPVQYRPGQTVTDWHVPTVEHHCRHTFHPCSSWRQYPHVKALGINFDLMDFPDVFIYKQQHLPGKYLAMLYDNFTIVFERAQIHSLRSDLGRSLQRSHLGSHFLQHPSTLHWQSDSDNLYTIWKNLED